MKIKYLMEYIKNAVISGKITEDSEIVVEWYAESEWGKIRAEVQSCRSEDNILIISLDE